ncbi:MAG TPA: penicillin acylase family protein [Pyrinomonadaceae bacterium]|nr:penicillin acylase family protein [Pyrinomonadaceae bacterium]
MKLTRLLLCLCAAASLAATATFTPSLTDAAAQTTAPAPQVPAQATTIKVDGLKSSVTVRRDERGIPYIEAASLEDLYFAQGYVTASDRLWQMDLLRRNARGELSEIFGRASLDEDKRHRTLGFARVAESMAEKSSPRARAAIEAYARGVNAYIDSLDDKSLPAEFQILRYRPRRWTAADTHVIGKNFSEALSTTWRLDVMRAAFADLPAERQAELFPSRSPLDVLVVGADRKTEAKPPARRKAASLEPEGRDAEAARVVGESLALLRAINDDAEVERRSHERVGLYAEELAASNNWVASGKRTVTGKPLLANDPHLAPSAPSIWHMVHLSAPGLRAAGVTSPGAPGVIIGHNERVAWGVTNLGPDVQDVYRERFESENSRRYMTPAGWRDAEVRREEIKVRKNFTDAATEVVEHEVIVTRHGPVVLEKGAERYALRWTALDGDAAEFEGFLLLSTARNWDEFRAALKEYRGPTQNFVYADVDGNIGYYGAGQIPLRKSGDGSLPYDGTTDAGEWAGYIPFEELPHVYNPPSGLIVTANSRVAGDTYPHHLTHAWAAPSRARRIYDLLDAKKKLSAEDFLAAQGDTYALSGVHFREQVRKIAAEAGFARRDAEWRATLDALERWNGRLEPDANPPLILGEMRSVFLRKVVEGLAGRERAQEYRWPASAAFVDRLIRERAPEWLPKGMKDYAELLDVVHKEARAELVKRYGADESKWTWEATQLARFQHPLAGVPFVGGQFLVEPFPARGSGGQMATPNVGSGVSMRLVADAADWDRTRQGIALGESGDPKSPHWKDQLADWRAVTPRVFPFTPRAVAAAARMTTTLAPK